MAGRLVISLRRAAGLPVRDWHYFFIAIKELFLARIRHGTQPMAKILADLHEAGMASPVHGDVNVAQVSWAIGAAAARVPWRADCLVQAMAAHRWLRRHRCHPQFFLGAQIHRTGLFQAHAWLRCNGVAVTGGSGNEFTALLAPAQDRTPL
jgi:Transglutaminase-like superfamily